MCKSPFIFFSSKIADLRSGKVCVFIEFVFLSEFWFLLLKLITYNLNFINIYFLKKLCMYFVSYFTIRDLSAFETLLIFKTILTHIYLDIYPVAQIQYKLLTSVFRKIGLSCEVRHFFFHNSCHLSSYSPNPEISFTLLLQIVREI